MIYDIKVHMMDTKFDYLVKEIGNHFLHFLIFPFYLFY